MIKPKTSDSEAPAGALASLPRRDFVRYAGSGLALTGLLLAGCNDDDNDDNNQTVDVGTGDTGVLNYAYALEQLEAAFYTQVVAGAFYNSATAAEKAILQDILAHEVAHRDFFRQVLGNGRIRDLQPNFSAINFGDRASVLAAARDFEDLGVHAYNGAGRFLSDATNLTLAGKIVSVEARHAALIRELLQANTFVAQDVVNLQTGLERSKAPAAVVEVANRFLQEGSKLSVNNLR